MSPRHDVCCLRSWYCRLGAQHATKLPSVRGGELGMGMVLSVEMDGRVLDWCLLVGCIGYAATWRGEGWGRGEGIDAMEEVIGLWFT